MFVFIVWHATAYRQPKRNRFPPHMTPQKRAIAQSKAKQDCLSQLGAKRWDIDPDYRIYRVKVPNNPPSSLLAEIGEACDDCGLDGPFWGEGQIAWQGQGAGAAWHGAGKLVRQTAEKFLRAKLDLLAQIRILAGYQSQTEAFELVDVPQEMRERWTALLTPEIDRWMEYLAGKGEEAYNKAVFLLSTKENHEAFFGDTENPLFPYMAEMPINVKAFRVHGRAMSASEKASLTAIQAGVASVVVDTVAPTKVTDTVKQEIEGTELGTFTHKGRTWNNVIWG